MGAVVVWVERIQKILQLWLGLGLGLGMGAVVVWVEGIQEVLRIFVFAVAVAEKGIILKEIERRLVRLGSMPRGLGLGLRRAGDPRNTPGWRFLPPPVRRHGRVRAPPGWLLPGGPPGTQHTDVNTPASIVRFHMHRYGRCTTRSAPTCAGVTLPTGLTQ